MIPIQFKNYTKYYYKNIGVSNIDFCVNPGEIMGFIGPNGAGKSTCIKGLLGLLKPTEGEALLMDNNAFLNGEIAREFVGYVPGEISLPQSQSVKEVLEFSAKLKNASMEHVNYLCELLELSTDKAIRTLSLGNKKKVQIVQALMGNPKVLILDEPTTGLDPIIQHIFFNLLDEEKKHGTTVLISSHNLKDIEKVCDKVAIIKDGKILAIENVKELKNKTLKHVSFETEMVNANFDLEGVYNLQVEDGHYSFNFNGDTAELFKVINKLKATNLTIEDAKLEDIFLHYYEVRK